MSKVYFSDAVVRELAEPAKGAKTHFFRGAIIEGKAIPPGLGVQVTANGSKSFTLVYRDADGRQRRETIGRWPGWSCVNAARRARELRQALDRGEAIGKAKAKAERDERGPTVADVLDDFVRRHVRGKLRTADEYARIFDRYVKPAIGEKGVHELKRLDIVTMLDAIEDGGVTKPAKKAGGKRSNGSANGAPVMADRVLARLRTAFNWQAARDDEFVSPIVRGMARTKGTERARDRILSDADLRTLWEALEQPTEGDEGERLPECYPGYVRTLLLTAQRREEVATMRWEDITVDANGDWLWTIPPERYKTKRANVVPLSKEALEMIDAEGKRRGKRNGFVFSTAGGDRSFSGYGKAKSALEQRMLTLRLRAKRPEVEHWTLHDLRRTARSLMSRSGVQPDIAERVLGHVIPGVRGVYDRHAYVDEKREALQKLADGVENIVGW